MLVAKILGKIALAVASILAFKMFLAISWRLRIPEFSTISVIGAWLIGLVSLEIVWLWRKRKPFPRLLSHLRYGPVAVLIFSIAITLSFDAVMIEHSKYVIRSYVHGRSNPESIVDLKLHNDYRGWCGNGYTAREYYLYAETAAEGFSSPDPAVRARSLQASVAVYDWLNGVDDGPFYPIMDKAVRDDDPLVRAIAADFRRSMWRR